MFPPRSLVLEPFWYGIGCKLWSFGLKLGIFAPEDRHLFLSDAGSPPLPYLYLTTEGKHTSRWLRLPQRKSVRARLHLGRDQKLPPRPNALLEPGGVIW